MAGSCCVALVAGGCEVVPTLYAGSGEAGWLEEEAGGRPGLGVGAKKEPKREIEIERERPAVNLLDIIG